LPRLNPDLLADALRRLPLDELDLALASKVVPIVTLPGLVLHAACGEPALWLAREQGRKIVAEAGVPDFHEAVRQVHGERIRRAATLGLARSDPIKSASRRLTGPQTAVALFIFAAALAATFLMPPRICWAAVNLLAGVFFLGVVALRMLCLMPEPGRPVPPRPVALDDRELPVYSVLVPLFRETSVLRRSLTSS
jgi:hypothetical protein